MEVEEIPFTDLLAKIVDNRGRTCPTVETGLPLIATNCVRNDLLYPAFEKVRYVSKDTYDSWFRGHPEPGDLIFVCKGTPGRVCMTPDPVSFCIAQDMVAVRAAPKKVYPKYLFAVLRSSAVQAQISNMHVGTLIPHFKKGDFDKLLLPVPDKKTQETIGDIYFELSAKIELNRRMNATLEAMARALFLSWFVDFDPVRAKLDGRKPVGLDPATAALFPEHLEDSPLGHIPKGWKVRTIESVCSTVTRGVTPEYGEGTGRFIINQRVNRGSDLDWSSLKELSQGLEVPPERFAKRWDVLVNCLGEGTLGRTHLYKGESDIYAIDQHMSICRAEHPAGGAYIYQVLSAADGQAKIESLKTGSTGMTMFNISRLRTFELVWPSAEILAAYLKAVEPLWLRIANNDQESRALATLRDTLLPKLLAGELNVSGALPLS